MGTRPEHEVHHNSDGMSNLSRFTPDRGWGSGTFLDLYVGYVKVSDPAEMLIHGTALT